VIERLINGSFPHLGPKFIDPSFRATERLLFARAFHEEALRAAIAGQIDYALALNDQAISLCNNIKPDKGFFLSGQVEEETQLSSSIQNDTEALIREHYGHVNFDYFAFERSNAFHNAAGAGKDSSITKNMIGLYQGLFSRYPALCKETLAADLLELVFYEGSKTAHEILGALEIDPDHFESTQVDCEHARQFNLSLPINMNSLLHLYYGTGLWKNHLFPLGIGTLYARTSRMLIAWAAAQVGVAAGEREELAWILYKFVPDSAVVNRPRGLVFTGKVRSPDLAEGQPLVKYARSMEQVSDLITSQRSGSAIVQDTVFYAQTLAIQPFLDLIHSLSKRDA